MKQLVVNSEGKNVLVDAPMPTYNAGQVLIKLTYGGVCMSEHYGWEMRKEGASFGHEPVGVVVEVGSQVTQFKPGDRVSGLFAGNAEYAVANVNLIFKIPDGVKDYEATLEPLACLVSAVSKARFTVVGQKVAVVGCGYMGCGAIGLLKRRGAYVTAFDIRPESLENAKRFGADEVCLVKDIPAEFKNGKNGFDLVMEWGETEESLNLAIDLTNMCGQLCVGAYHNNNKGMRTVNFERLNVRAIDCLSTHPRESGLLIKSAEAAMKMIGDGSWNYRSVPTKIYSIADFDLAHEELPDKFGKWLKAVVDWSDMEGKNKPYIVE